MPKQYLMASEFMMNTVDMQMLQYSIQISKYFRVCHSRGCMRQRRCTCQILNEAERAKQRKRALFRTLRTTRQGKGWVLLGARAGGTAYPPTSSSLRNANLFLTRHRGSRRTVAPVCVCSSFATRRAGSDPANQSRTWRIVQM